MTIEADETPVTLTDLQETIAAFSFLFTSLNHRLDVEGAMSAIRYQDDMLRIRDMFAAYLPPHPEGDDRLALWIFDSVVNGLDLRQQGTSKQHAYSDRLPLLSVIEGGRGKG
jgi:hypothetical protein